MFYIIVILAAIFTMPSNALDGKAPANVAPQVGIPLGNNPDADFTLQRGAAYLLAQASNPGGAASLREQLVGAWTLVSCDGIDGTELPWCVNPNGIHILDASGHYTTVNAARGRPKFTDANRPRSALSAEEFKAAAMGLVAQFGTWSVNEAEKTITYHVEGALFPNIEGTDGKVTVSLSGDELKLVGGLGPSVWRRIKK